MRGRQKEKTLRFYAPILAGSTSMLAVIAVMAMCSGVVRAGVPGLSMQKAAAGKIYYEPTIKKIIAADCARCHSGATNNLTDYDSLKMYADSGMLAAMVQGSMRRFTGNAGRVILDWLASGAPEKRGGAAAGFAFGFRRMGPGPVLNARLHPGGRITYSRPVRDILAADCLRCHSGQFRNMTTYKNVKMYVDNGLLKTLVQLGGPMHRFAGPDSRAILAWIKIGAPQ